MVQSISSQQWDSVYNAGNQAQKATLDAQRKNGMISVTSTPTPTTNSTAQTTAQTGGSSSSPQWASGSGFTNLTQGTTVQPGSGFGGAPASTSSTNSQGSDTATTTTSLSNPMNNYSYGQAASQTSLTSPDYLDKRNTDLATYFGQQGVTDAKGIQNALSANEQYANAHPNDQSTTAQAIADKISQQQKDQQGAADLQKIQDQKNANDQTLASVQASNKYKMDTGVSHVMSDIDRANVLATRDEQTNQDSLDRGNQMADRQVADAKIKTSDNIADVSDQMNKATNASNISGALSGANQSSAFQSGIQQIQTDANKIIDRLSRDQNNLVDYTAEDKQYLLKQWTENQDKIQQDWAYKMRDFTTQMQTDIKTGLDKYKIDSDKLGQYLDESVIKPYIASNYAAFKDWQDSNQAINDNMFTNLENIYKLNTLSQQADKTTVDALMANNGAALQYMTYDDIDNLVKQGKLSSVNGQIQKSNMIAGAVKGLQTYGLPTQEDIDQLTSAIKANKEPGQVMAQITSAHPDRYNINPGGFKPNVQVIGEDAYGNKQYGYFDNNGNLTPTNASGGDPWQGVEGYSQGGAGLDTDLSTMKADYPNDAGVANNNPAGITYNDQFAQTLTNNGIQFTQGGNRGPGEGGNYFKFPTLGEGMKAYNLLWSTPSYQNKTVQSALNTWGTGNIAGLTDTQKNMTVGQLQQSDPQAFQQIQLQQIKKESPGVYKALTSASAQQPTDNQDVGFGDAVKGAFQQVSQNIPSTNQSTAMQNVIAAAKTSPEAAQTVLKNIYEKYSGLGVDGAKKFDANYQIVSALKYMTDHFSDADVGVAKGKLENIANSIGVTNDPDLVMYKQFIGNTVDMLTRLRTGAALNKEEETYYKSIFPGIDKSPKLNQALIKGLTDSMNQNVSSQLANFYTPTYYDAIWGKGGSSEAGVGDSSSSDSDPLGIR